MGDFILPNPCLPFLLLCFSSSIFAQLTERITPKLLFGFQNSNSGVIWAISFSPILAFLFCFFAFLPLYLIHFPQSLPFFLFFCFSSFISAQVTERVTPKLLFGFPNSNSGVIWAHSFSPIIAFLFCFFVSLPLYLPS